MALEVPAINRAPAHISNTTQESLMNWDQIEGNWKQLKGKAKEQWGKLTDDQLDVIAGKRDQLAGTIQEQYGYTKERVNEELDRWANASDLPDVDKPSKH
jgi:uncharacterized protein YjbJ (UPF0337 family)